MRSARETVEGIASLPPAPFTAFAVLAGVASAAKMALIGESGPSMLTSRLDTSAAVAKWARRGLLPEVRNGAGRPRYRRADVEELLRSGFRQKPR